MVQEWFTYTFYKKQPKEIKCLDCSKGPAHPGLKATLEDVLPWLLCGVGYSDSSRNRWTSLEDPAKCTPPCPPIGHRVMIWRTVSTIHWGPEASVRALYTVTEHSTVLSEA